MTAQAKSFVKMQEVGQGPTYKQLNNSLALKSTDKSAIDLRSENYALQCISEDCDCETISVSLLMEKGLLRKD